MYKMAAAFISFVLLFLRIINVEGKSCPKGGKIFALGISVAGQEEVVNLHNKYRLQIAQGKVTNQPRGINLLKMVYDKQLGTEARPVSNQCEMRHQISHDSRWPNIGQNIYIEWSSSPSTNQNWTKAVTSWFNEHENFKYPKTSKGTTGHYTQVVWATSKYVGCDFIYFYDTTMPKVPYAKMYTCNYGPAGNYVDAPPYQAGTSGCNNLC